MADADALHAELLSTRGACGAWCFDELLRMDEAALCARLHQKVLNFYPADGVQPFVPLAAAGPWIVTAHGAVMYDVAGYGMNAFGHNPRFLLDAVGAPQVMANVMTPSFAQAKLTHALTSEIGRNWKGFNGERRVVEQRPISPLLDPAKAATTAAVPPQSQPDEETAMASPYHRFVCLNSGSEAVGLALRVTDAHARVATSKGAPHAGKTPVFITLKGSFHGRTDRAALASHSTRLTYAETLASWRTVWDEEEEEEFLTRATPVDVDDSFREASPARLVDLGGGLANGERTLRTTLPPPCVYVDPNDVDSLRAAFALCEAQGYFVEAFLMEPVMGEGDPGRAIERGFYDEARRLTRAHGGFFVVDSVQAGLRATGALSLVDYPGFATCDPPDFEVFSKALNGGQIPLSVVAFGAEAAEAYRAGIYGNTMVGPRGA